MIGKLMNRQPMNGKFMNGQQNPSTRTPHTLGQSAPGLFAFARAKYFKDFKKIAALFIAQMAFAVLSIPQIGQTAQAAPPVILGSDEIEVTTNFRGTDIELLAYLETESPNTKLVVVGPPAILTFRKKARRAGMWVNAERQVFHAVASYVALIGFTEADVAQACTNQAINDLAYWGSPSLEWVCDPDHRALMEKKGLFVLDKSEGATALGRGFFQASAFLPPTAKPGRYGLRFWVEGQSAQTKLDVRRAGLERWVLNTAENHRILYGLLCLVLAGLAGYLTNLIFSRRT